MGYLSDRSKEVNCLPSGHPEGLYEAFGNIYQAWIGAILKLVNGEELTKSDCDFPTVDAGLEGVRFIHACVKSNEMDSAWVEI